MNQKSPGRMNFSTVDPQESVWLSAEVLRTSRTLPAPSRVSCGLLPTSSSNSSTTRYLLVEHSTTSSSRDVIKIPQTDVQMSWRTYPIRKITTIIYISFCMNVIKYFLVFNNFSARSASLWDVEAPTSRRDSRSWRTAVIWSVCNYN